MLNKPLKTGAAFFYFYSLNFRIHAMHPEISKLYNHYLKYPEISTDSRKVKPNTLFFALKGENFDGNKYAHDALNKGAALAIADDDSIENHDRLIRVHDTLKTLQELATCHRSQLMIPVIGITGSNGKTTTKELINAVLNQKYRTFATTGNLNNHIGVPLSILSIDDSHEMAVIEMGANHQGEIAALCKIAQPDFGIITNIGKAHLEGFGGYQGVIKAKTELYGYLKNTHGKVFVNADDELLAEKSNGMNCIYYGNDSWTSAAGKITERFPFLAVEILVHNEKLSIQSKMVGSYNLANMVAAACIGDHFGISAEKIGIALSAYQPKNNRSQWLETASNKIVMDAYNANPSSMLLAIENFAEAPFDNKMLILGDMRELGNESRQEHRNILQKVSELGFGEVILVGQEFKKAAGKDTFYKIYDDVNQAVQGFQKSKPSNKTILTKGSRGIQLEKILEVL